jgi:hypothetical protein
MTTSAPALANAMAQAPADASAAASYYRGPAFERKAGKIYVFHRRLLT